jgi:hypothetical protein
VLKGFSTALLLIVSLLALSQGAAQDDPRISRILAMGTAAHTPILTYWFANEPSTDPTVIPIKVWGTVSGADIMRFMRIYFPRSFDDLVEYDFFFLASVDISYVSPRNQQWLHDALHEFPRAAVNTRSIMSGVSIYYEPWRDSILSDAFPNDVDAVIADETNFQGIRGPMVIRDDPGLPNIMKPYKKMVESTFREYGGLNTVPREGSTILSYTKNSQGVGSPIPGQIPHVFYWNWSRSITFTFRDKPNDAFWSAPETGSPLSNPYGLDIAVNVIWWSTGMGLPEDPLKVHEYRRLLFDYVIQRSLLISLLDFAEMFGGDSSGIYAESNAIDEGKRMSGSQYLDRDFDGAYESVKTAFGALVELQGKAMRLKDKALFWVYLAEWLVTLGTMMVSVAVLWSLMVRRMFHREIASTRWSA